MILSWPIYDFNSAQFMILSCSYLCFYLYFLSMYLSDLSFSFYPNRSFKSFYTNDSLYILYSSYESISNYCSVLLFILSAFSYSFFQTTYEVNKQKY